MKNLFPAVVAIFLASLAVACQKNDHPPERITQNDQTVYRHPSSGSTEEKKFHIFYVTWTEWGRTSRNCESGWGLCKAVSCWLCCTNDKDEIVDCKDDKRLKNAGKVVIDTGRGEGYMLIELEHSIPVQAEAISNSLPLYIDEDIQNDGFIIRKGVYHFDPEAGNSGGYRLSVMVK